MEAITLLTLILLALVGARNIPANMDKPSIEVQQIIEDSTASYTKTVPEGEIFYAVSAGDLEPKPNKDINEEETSEERDHNVAAMDNEEAKNLENKQKEDENQETARAAMNPVEVTNEYEEARGGLEDRDGFGGNHCPNGTRVGGICWIEDKD